MFFLTYLKANDRRIIVFGGADITTKHPAETYYEVLDVNTFRWYHSNKDIYIEAPYKGHTATLIENYMFIAFGKYIYYILLFYFILFFFFVFIYIYI
jgi:hypothetical protein